MRTTVTLPDALLAEAKQRAAEERVTLSDIVESALRERLLRSRGAAKKSRFRLVEFGEGGLQPGLSFERLKDLTLAEDMDRQMRGFGLRAADSDDAPPRR